MKEFSFKNIWITVVSTILIAVLATVTEYIVVKQLNKNDTDANYITVVPNSTPISNAFNYYGQKEKAINGKSNPVILGMLKEFGSWVTDTETPWCSAFMNYTNAQAGYPFTGSLSARSWLNIGTPVKSPVMGDIAVLWRGSKSGWQGHVAYFLSYSLDKKSIFLYGGNQGNSTTIQTYPIDRVLGFRRNKKVAQDNSAYDVNGIIRIPVDSIVTQ